MKYLARELARKFKLPRKLTAYAGRVIYVGGGVAKTTGLDRVASGEIVTFSAGVKGLALNLEAQHVGIAILGNDAEVSVGDFVIASGSSLQVPTGFSVLGRTLDAMGNMIDGLPELGRVETASVDVKAPYVIDRQPVRECLETGIKVIDALVPIGRGQRELIIGDRQTGKTSIGIDTIINQVRTNQLNDHAPVYCVYVSIGQRLAQTKQIRELLDRFGSLEQSVIVSAGASDAPALLYLAPYTATAIAEYFRDNGFHSLVVYDDLTKHANAYRQIGLILRRPPGREAFPADCFYAHARLLERAAKMSEIKGAGSLTALPIVETQEGDVSAFIPTNVISITDGQIYLESELFFHGIRPAVNLHLSVSRVGAKAQAKPLRKLASNLRVEIAQYRQAVLFAQFGGTIDEATQYILTRGELLTEFFQQGRYEGVPLENLIFSLFALTEGYFDLINPRRFFEVETALINYANSNEVFAPFLEAITEEYDEEALHAIVDLFFSEHPQYLKEKAA